MKSKITGMVLIATILSTTLLTACSGGVGKTEINLDEYVTVTFDGHDGAGTAIAAIDYESLQNDYGDTIQFDKSVEKDFPEMGDNVYQYIEKYAVAGASPSTDLSNGDSIDILWDVDEEFFEDLLNCQVSYSDVTYTVEGLDEIGTVDVFDSIDVLFSGVAPLGEAEIVVKNDYSHQLCSYTIDKDSDLSNGDVITVSFDIVDEDAFAEEYGVLPEYTSKEYTVSGLDSYIIDMSQLSEENINMLKEDSRDRVEADFMTGNKSALGGHTGIANWSQMKDLEHGDDYVLENIYFLSPKEPGKSEIVFIYSVSLTLTFLDSWHREPESGRVYYAVAYTDLIQEENGELIGISDFKLTLGSDGNIDDLYKKYISENKDDYTATIYDADLNIAK